MSKKLGVMLGATVAVLALTMGSASAFECYNASRSATGNAHAAKSPALASPAELLASEGLCTAGIDFVLAGLSDAGFSTDVLINERTLMAGGLEKNGKGETLLHDGKGIDHLSDEFFATLFPLIGEAFGLCGAP